MSHMLLPHHMQQPASSGIILFHNSPHSTFAVTNPGLYNYFPTNLTAQKLIHQHGATISMWYRTHHAVNNIMKWWVLCALEQDCFAPSGHRGGCKFGPSKEDHFLVYTNCHRYDQSVINVILSNYFYFNESNYSRDHTFYKVFRGDNKDNGETPQYC